jgi:hypothetical protein
VEQQTDNHSGGIRIAFGEARSAFARIADDAPQPVEKEKRKRGDTDKDRGGMRQPFRTATRPVTINFRGIAKASFRQGKQTVQRASTWWPAEASDRAAPCDALDSANPYWEFEADLTDETHYDSEAQRPDDTTPDYPSFGL